MEKQDVKPLWDKQALAALNDGQFGDAWEALIQAYEKDVLARCILWMGDKASGVEVAQEVFLKIRDALPDFRRESSFRRWIMDITANTCKQHISLPDTSSIRRYIV